MTDSRWHSVAVNSDTEWGEITGSIAVFCLNESCVWPGMTEPGGNMLIDRAVYWKNRHDEYVEMKSNEA